MTTTTQETAPPRPTRPGKWFLLTWGFANAAGAVVACILLFLVAAYVRSLPRVGLPSGTQLPEWATLLAAAVALLFSFCLGASIGAMQWFAIRKHLVAPGWWFGTNGLAMCAAIVAFTVGFLNASQHASPAAAVVDVVPRFALAWFALWFTFGTASGVLQWLILWRQPHLAATGWWIAANMLAGAIAGLAWTSFAFYGGLLVWALTGILTGAVFLRLFRGEKRSAERGVAG